MQDLFFPKRMMLDPSSICNLNCPMCPNPDPKIKKGMMTPEVFNRLLPVFPYLYEIVIVGTGEPFLNPNTIDFLTKIKRHGLSLRIYTNGTMLDEQLIDKLLDIRLDFLTISLDAAEDGLYQRIRHPSQLSEILHKIEIIKNKKLTMGIDYPKLWFNMVGMNINIDQAPKLVALAHRYNVEKVTITYFRRTEFSDETLSHPSQEETFDAISQAVKLARKLGVNLSFPKLLDNNYPAKYRSFRPKYINQLIYLNSFYTSKKDIYIQVYNRFICKSQQLGPRFHKLIINKIKRKLPYWRSKNIKLRLYQDSPIEYIYIHHNGDVGTCCDNLNIIWGNILEDNLVDIWSKKMLPTLNQKILEMGMHRCPECGRRWLFEDYV